MTAIYAEAAAGAVDNDRSIDGTVGAMGAVEDSVAGRTMMLLAENDHSSDTCIDRNG